MIFPIFVQRYLTTKVRGYNFEYFLSTPTKLKQFAVCVDMQNKFNFLKDYQLSIIGCSNDNSDD